MVDFRRQKAEGRRQKKPTFKNKPGTVTMAGKLNVDVPIGTLKNIWRQAQLE
ncbi:MAG: addiction module toxin, HicA family [Nostoc sp. DedSLP03]|uniref:addiction module toxin, HicA family n=1 Tax=Nostoc sp. DedSLP03 TaxID=3075400 RepID=UPI002AD5AFF1|nr:addiction module toxin, HicA family [Nostoc sp. DedSLP03]MDZ7965318.1 addiction module toxin, HicA family [Nostoc sp. DedSLP03]